MKRDERLINNVCPNCDMKADDSTHTKGIDTLPEPDDISICVGCCCILQHQEDLSLKEISEAEILNISFELHAKVVHVRNTLIKVKLRQN